MQESTSRDKRWSSFFMGGPAVSADFFADRALLPLAGQDLPATMKVIIRQHVDNDNGGILKTWVEILDPPVEPQEHVAMFVDRALAAGEPQCHYRQITAEVVGPSALDHLLEKAFQNELGVWPIPRRGLRADLATLGYSLDWPMSDELNTITPVAIRALTS